MAKIHHEIDEQLHRAAKSAAALQGISLKAFIEAALADAVRRAKTG